MLPSLQRKTAAQKSAQAVTNALNSHRIPHTPSLNPGMVTITSPGRPLVHLRLQKDLGTNHWRWMLDGSTEWLTCHSKTFLALFSCKKEWLANTTKTELLFGPYEGQTVAAVFSQDPAHLLDLINSKRLWKPTKMLLTVAVNQLVSATKTFSLPQTT